MDFNNYKVIKPEDLNHYGYLFGGYLLKWVDEYAWIAASLDYPDCNFVTVALDKVEFKKSVKEGTILRFDVTKTRKGNTSVQYRISVFRGHSDHQGEDSIFTTCITLVRINENGEKIPLPN